MVALLGAVLCLALAPSAVPEGYSTVEHTPSEAGAQATQGAWLARSGFLLFGLAVFCLSVVKRGWPRSARYLHGLFGLLLLATAVYSQRPFVEGVSYDHVEDLLHSVAATAMGIVFVAGVLVVGWLRIPRWKLVDVVALASAVGIPIAMTATAGIDGLLQRVMFGIAFVWYGLEVIDTQRRTSFDMSG